MKHFQAVKTKDLIEIVPLISAAKRRQHVAVGVSPMALTLDLVSRRALAAGAESPMITEEPPAASALPLTSNLTQI